jgi:hypothetical protein
MMPASLDAVHESLVPIYLCLPSIIHGELKICHQLYQPPGGWWLGLWRLTALLVTVVDTTRQSAGMM